RFFSGFLTMRISDRNMIRLGQGVIALGLLLILLPLGSGVLFAGLILLGLGCAPIYPCIIHETPANFGRALSMALTGLQMAFAYVGTCVMPPLFGLLADKISPALYPWYMAVLLAVMFIMAEELHKKTAVR
ncbi:MAG: MFS transporter, partial [Gemmiger sp.]